MIAEYAMGTAENLRKTWGDKSREHSIVDEEYGGESMTDCLVRTRCGGYLDEGYRTEDGEHKKQLKALAKLCEKPERPVRSNFSLVFAGARVFLKEKRYAEAEKAARSSARTLEHSDRPSLLAEALKRHGTALARLGNYSAALSAFRRAIALHQEIDSLNRAGDVALTLVQELGEQLAIKGAITTSGPHIG